MTRPPLPQVPYLVAVVGAAIIGGGRCLVAQRGPGGLEGGKWEFPGGKIEPGESPEVALAREIEEELSVSISVGSWLGRGLRKSPRRTIILDVYEAELRGPVSIDRPPVGPDHSETRWVMSQDLDSLDWAQADIPVIPLVRERLNARAAATPGEN